MELDDVRVAINNWDMMRVNPVNATRLCIYADTKVDVLVSVTADSFSPASLKGSLCLLPKEQYTGEGKLKKGCVS